MAEWYYAKNDQKHGPISEALLAELAANGTLQPDDLVWTEELNEWIKAEKVEGLKFHKLPPPLPGTAPMPSCELAPPAAPSGRAQAGPSTVRQGGGRSGLAVASLVLGILAPLLFILGLLLIILDFRSLFEWAIVLSGVTAILAIICGHLARALIAAARSAVTGNNMALVGLILGYVYVGMLLMAVPGYMKARSTTLQNMCIVGLRVVDHGVQQWAMEKGQNDCAEVDAAAIATYMKDSTMPTCNGVPITAPARVGDKPVCPNGIPGHALPRDSSFYDAVPGASPPP